MSERQARPGFWITRRRLHILCYVHEYLQKYGHAPKLAEIARAVGMTSSGVSQQLTKLERRGYIRRGRGWRGIKEVRLPEEPEFETKRRRIR